jgi:hypothetical protein
MEAKVAAKSSGVTNVTMDVNMITGVGSQYFGGFTSATGYDVVSNVGYRNLLGQSLANTYSHGGEWSLYSLILSMNTQFTAPITVRFVVTFKNGVKVIFVLTAAQIEQANYQAGQSVDAEGHPIPDSSITNPNTAPGTFGGNYTFRTDSSLQNWLNAARDAGVPISGGSSRKIACVWVGSAMYCRYVYQ